MAIASDINMPQQQLAASCCNQSLQAIYSCISPTQCALILGQEDNPILMWGTLQTHHQQQRAGSRFNAMDDLLAICMKENESLTSMAAQISEKMATIKNLRPAAYTIDNSDDELEMMAMIRGLPTDYLQFASTILLNNNLTKAKIVAAFHIEEIPQERCSTDTASIAASSSKALAAQSPPQHKNKDQCDLCKIKGHTLRNCHQWRQACKRNLTWKAVVKEAKTRRANKLNQGQGGSRPHQAKPAIAAAAVAEFAGNASRFSDPSSPFTPLQLNAHYDWIADSGATSHMTPHCHWFRTYTTNCVPIRLADNTVVYSSGIGSVVFIPVMRGKDAREVEFTCVLHVPNLRSNLLSILHLTQNSGIHISIDQKFIHVTGMQTPETSLALIPLRPVLSRLSRSLVYSSLIPDT